MPGLLSHLAAFEVENMSPIQQQQHLSYHLSNRGYVFKLMPVFAGRLINLHSETTEGGAVYDIDMHHITADSASASSDFVSLFYRLNFNVQANDCLGFLEYVFHGLFSI